MGIDICSVLGHEARGMTGGRTDNSRSGNVPEILGLFDFVFSVKSPSMTISGYIGKKKNGKLQIEL